MRAARSLDAHPRRVGRYDLLFPLGAGGMATVYLAQIRSGFDFEREVAVKLIHPHLRVAAGDQDLLDEARLAARIRHPHVVPTLDVGRDDAGIYLVMDYVEGDALSALMAAPRRVSPRVLLRLLAEALEGLHAVHELRDAEGAPMRVVHRDFTPQNILVGIDGVARLADFGVAKAASRLARTATGVVKGKFGYMSPEQARAETLDRRSDVWAAGVIAWEIVAEQSLHRRGNDASTLLAIVSADPPRLCGLRPSVPPALDDVVARALARDPRHRIATAHALAEALESACRGTDFELASRAEVVDEVGSALEPEMARRRARAAQARRSEASEPPPAQPSEKTPAQPIATTVAITEVVGGTIAATSAAAPTQVATTTLPLRRRSWLALAVAAPLVAATTLYLGASEPRLAETSLPADGFLLPSPAQQGPVEPPSASEPAPKAAERAPLTPRPLPARQPRRPAPEPKASRPNEPLSNPWRHAP